MSPDRRLPASQEELRDWLAQAWADGWKARRQLIGKPSGTIIHERPARLDAFLRSWDLPPMPKPESVSIREALTRILDND